MRRTAAVSIAVLALLASASCIVSTYPEPPVARPPLPPPMAYDVGLFFDALDPYGDWLHLPAYGWVWRPTAVALDFQPYTDGRWIYTDDGWTWISEEPWGWAPYHYGRWFYDAHYGWCWLPGTEWAPAWVVFRWGDGWFGWAPAPPGVRVRAGIGIDLGGLNLDIVIQPFMWRFVPERYAFETRVGRHMAPPARNVTIVRVTKTVVNYVVVQNRVVNRGVDVDELARTAGLAPPRHRIVNADAPGRATATAREVRVYRPEVRPAPAARAPARGRYVADEDQKSAPRPGTPADRSGPQRSRQAEAHPVPVAVPAADLEARRKREEAERADLEKRLEARKRALRREHEREAASPPPNLDEERLRTRQEAEKRAFEEEAKRQRELLLRRQKEREEGEANAQGKPKEKSPKPQKKTVRKAAPPRPDGGRE